MLQTKVTDNNKQDFYKSVYYMHLNSRDQLVDIANFDKPCVIIDCCGFHYKSIFQKNNIIVLETFTSAKEYKFSRDQFDRLIDNQQADHIKWPAVDVIDPILIFDRSPLLKYLNISNLCNLISDAAEKYSASNIVVRQKLCFLDDLRTTDRFYNFQNFKIKNYCVEKFVYNTKIDEYEIWLKRTTLVE
jgi:hypothetical protein